MDGWDRARECEPRCFWEEAREWPLQMWRLWLEVGQGEKLSEERTQWSIDHAALRNYIDYNDPLTGGCEEWELVRAMTTVKRELNIGERDAFKVLEEVPEDDGC